MRRLLLSLLVALPSDGQQALLCAPMPLTQQRKEPGLERAEPVPSEPEAESCFPGSVLDDEAS